MQPFSETDIFQTEEVNILSLRTDGFIAFNKSHYVFKDNSGWLHLSEVETIHYSNVGLTERRYPDIVDVSLKIENEFAKICNTK